MPSSLYYPLSDLTRLARKAVREHAPKGSRYVSARISVRNDGASLHAIYLDPFIGKVTDTSYVTVAL